MQVEKHSNKSYNYNVNSIGMLSSYSNAASAYSVYGTPRVQSTENKQDDSDAQLPVQKKDDDIEDTAIISDKAKELAEKDKEPHIQGTSDTNKDDSFDNKTEPKSNISKKGETLSPEQQQEVAQLKARDAEVKAHEQAHIAAAGGLTTSAPSYSYQSGPDGQKYAIGGEVSVSAPQTNNPEENIRNAEALKRAAMAPADPSSQDRAVAANADKIIAANREKLAEEQQKNNESESKPNASIKNDTDPAQTEMASV